MPKRPTWESSRIRGISSYVQKGRGKNRGITKVLIPLTGKSIVYYGEPRSPITRTIKPLRIRRK